MRSRMRSRVLLRACAAAVLAYLCGAESLKSRVKMQRSNPVVSVVVDGESVRLILTTDTDGILICSDLPKDASASSKVDFDYARKLLRFQLQGMIQDFEMRAIHVPALAFTGRMPIAYFHLKNQWLSPASIEYFLQSSNASGFIGVGFAFRPMYSRFWTMIDDHEDDEDAVGFPSSSPSSPPVAQQYAYRGMNADGTKKKLAALSIPTGQADKDNDEADEDLVNGYIGSSEIPKKLVWSEPLAPVNDREDAANSQGISFPVHRAHFQCAPTLTDPEVSSSSSSLNAHAAHSVDIFGEFSGNWDVSLDFNVPCLGLPQQFFDSLAGWLGLRFNDELKVAEISGSAALPDLVFSLSLDGPQLRVPLQRLVLSELQVSTSPSSAGNSTNNSSSPPSSVILQRICIQRSGSIIQNGAAVFSPLDQDAGSVQRYRLHGSLTLPLFNMFQAPIVFGAMVLDAFEQIIVDGTTKRTGIQNLLLKPSLSPSVGDKNGGNEAAFVTCMRPVRCVGQQQYLPRLNACQDPDCSLYFFHSLDATTKQCTLDGSWVVAVVVTMSAFLAVEALFSLSMRHFIRKTRLNSLS